MMNPTSKLAVNKINCFESYKTEKWDSFDLIVNLL